MAGEEFFSQALFKRVKLAADGRLRKPQFFAGTGDAAPSGDHPEIKEMVIIEPFVGGSLIPDNRYNAFRVFYRSYIRIQSSVRGRKRRYIMTAMDLKILETALQTRAGELARSTGKNPTKLPSGGRRIPSTKSFLLVQDFELSRASGGGAELHTWRYLWNLLAL